MRTLAAATLGLAAALALSACATRAGESATSSYGAEMDKLSRECNARGGILTPTQVLPESTRLTGRPELDYDCTIRGGAGRLR